MRRLLLVVAFSCMVLLAAGTVVAAPASASTMPAEGVFEGCPFDTAMPTCLQRLQVMHQGGVNVVVTSAAGSSPSALATYAAAAHSLGMGVMWETSNQQWWESPMTSTTMAGYYPAFAAACGCKENGQLLAYLIHFLGSQPGTYGYYAADDSMLGPGDRTGVAAYIAAIKQQDPVHMVLIGSANGVQARTYEGLADTIGQEIYPVTTYSLLPVGPNQSLWDWVGQLASRSQSLADRDGKDTAFILQAFTWGDNLDDGQAIGGCTSTQTPLSCYHTLRYPSGAEQLELRNEVLEHAHPKLILWWSFQGTYGQAGDDTYSIYPTGAVAAARWRGLSKAIEAPLPGASPASPVSRAASVHPAHRRARTARDRRRGRRQHRRRSGHAGRQHLRHGSRHRVRRARRRRVRHAAGDHARHAAGDHARQRARH